MRQVFTFEEVDAMRPSRVWNAYKNVRLERALIAVPRADGRSLRTYVAGKRFQ